MDWQAQKMNIIIGGIVVVIAGMMAYKFHIIGGGDSTAPHKTAPAAFAAPASALPATQKQAPSTAAPAAPVPVATATPPSAMATPPDQSLGTPASISMGGSSSGQTSQPSVSEGEVTPISTTATTQSAAGSTVAKDMASLHQEVLQIQSEVQELSDDMGKMQEHDIMAERHLQERIRQVKSEAHNPFAGQSVATRSEVAGYHLQSMGETEAWLTNPAGETVIARAGEHLPGITIIAVTPNGVKTSAGWLGF